MSERRGVIIGALVVFLVAGGLVDRTGRHQVAASPAPPHDPVALPADGGASTWFCPLANAQPDAGLSADGTIVIQNTRGNAIDGLLTLYPANGEPVTVALRAPARGRLLAHESEFITAGVVAAVVEMEQGGVAVEQTVNGPIGETTSPCSTTAGDRWYVAEGSTALNQAMYLGLFNPFPEDAIVDLDFATDQGRTAPGAFQRIVVGARSVLAVSIGDHVRRRDHVAVTAVARRGRIVVGRLQTRTAPRSGLTLALATPAPRTSWDFPDGITGDAVSERFHIYNPTKKDATVQLALTLDQGAAEPFELKVPAGERLTLDPGSESRIPKGVGHAATVRSNVPVVAERTLDYVAPSLRLGFSIAVGATRSARQWYLPQGGITESQEEWVVVHNRDQRAVRVSVTAVTGGQRVPLEGLTDVEIPGGQRRSFRLIDVVSRPDLPMVVNATGPVVVERVLARVGRPGLTQTMAVPVA
ncbi:MAG: hypothetical protein H0W70_09365 [Actinobacteria bacterium]|nr:hypothetical protein [Actinomycetota bacterium]